MSEAGLGVSRARSTHVFVRFDVERPRRVDSRTLHFLVAKDGCAPKDRRPAAVEDERVPECIDALALFDIIPALKTRRGAGATNLVEAIREDDRRGRVHVIDCLERAVCREEVVGKQDLCLKQVQCPGGVEFRQCNGEILQCVCKKLWLQLLRTRIGGQVRPHEAGGSDQRKLMMRQSDVGEYSLLLEAG